jgi:hypothetical protein
MVTAYTTSPPDRVRLWRDIYRLTLNFDAQRFHAHGRLLSHGHLGYVSLAQVGGLDLEMV